MSAAIDTGLTLSRAACDALLPMHVIVSATGHIVHAGPTLKKLRREPSLIGRRFLEAFEVKRPRNLVSISDLSHHQGMRLHLQFRDARRTQLKGQVVALAGPDDLTLVNLSFGISVVDAVRDNALTSADFAPTDLTVEMLYLVEAKSAVMEESRNLNLRLQGAKIAAEEQAYTDTLTGLKNRRAMDHVLARLIDQQTAFALMHLDLDYFKDVNDTLGHAAGDFVLQEVARVLVDETREIDLVARVGGDEFVLIFSELTDHSRLNAIAGRIIARLEEPLLYEGRECRISASIGTTTSTYYGRPDADQMLGDADIALYASKRQGRAQSTIVTDRVLADAASEPQVAVGRAARAF